MPDARERLERLRPATRELSEMMAKLKPFGPDYCIVLAAREAMTTLAFHFTGDPTFYADKGTSSSGTDGAPKT